MYVCMYTYIYIYIYTHSPGRDCAAGRSSQLQDSTGAARDMCDTNKRRRPAPEDLPPSRRRSFGPVRGISKCR